VEHADIELHVLPLHSEELLETHPGVDVSRDQDAVSIRRMSKEGVDLASRERARCILRSPTRQFLTREPVKRILGDVSAPNSKSQGPPEGREQAAKGPRGEARLTPVVEETGESLGGQLLNGYVSQLGYDVALKMLPIPLYGAC
jgi:hypothetical protein